MDHLRLAEDYLKAQRLQEAEDKFRAALTKLNVDTDLALVADCLRGIGDVGIRQSNLVKAEENYAKSEVFCSQLDDKLGRAHAAKRIGNVLFCRSDFSSALSKFETAYTLYVECGHLIGQAKCIRSRGDTTLLLKDYKQAADDFAKAIYLFHLGGDELGFASCISGMGEVARGYDRRDEAESYLSCALTTYQRLGHLWSQAFVTRILCGLMLDVDDYPGARNMAEKALKLAVASENKLEVANCLRDYAIACLGDQDYRRAKAVLEHCVRLFGQVGNDPDKTQCENLLASIQDIPVSMPTPEEHRETIRWRITYGPHHIFDQFKPQYTQILPQLYIADVVTATTPETYTALGVTHTLSVMMDADIPNIDVGIPASRRHSIQILDRASDRLEEHLPEAVRFLKNSLQDSNAVVLCFCFAGISRSVSVVVAYLMAEHGKSLDDAVEFIKEKRRIAQPSETFMDQIASWNTTRLGAV